MDATGLKGKYDFTLYWVSGPDGGRPVSGPNADLGPSLLEALQQQLGLKLEPKKGAVKVLVVDHAKRTPAEN